MDRTPRGRPRDLYSAVPLRDGAGHVVGALEVVTDQTALKRTVEPGGGGPNAGRASSADRRPGLRWRRARGWARCAANR